MVVSNEVSWPIKIFGERRVGKTDFLARMIDQHSVPSAGVLLKLTKWAMSSPAQVGGVEEFRKFIPAYLRNCRLVLLVYDVTRTDSTDILRTWQGGYSPDPNRNLHAVVVVGNKVDLLPDGGASLMTDEALQQGALPPDAVAESTTAVRTADAFCKQQRISHYAVSAMTGAGFEGMTREAMELSLSECGFPISVTNKGGIRFPFA